MGKNLKGKELGKGFGQRKDGRYEAGLLCQADGTFCRHQLHRRGHA